MKEPAVAHQQWSACEPNENMGGNSSSGERGAAPEHGSANAEVAQPAVAKSANPEMI